MKQLFTRKTDYLVAAFVVLAIVMLARCESAEAGELAAEYFHDSNSGVTPFNDGWDNIGARYTFDTGTSVYFSPIVGVGGDLQNVFEDGSFTFGIGEMIAPRWQVQLNLAQYDADVFGGASLRRYIGDGPFRLALGGSYWIESAPGSGSAFTFNLGMSWAF